jgi:drug/metabolite transporter (DMT)-like permease
MFFMFLGVMLSLWPPLQANGSSGLPASKFIASCVCVLGVCVFVHFSFVFLASHRLPCDKISFSPFLGKKGCGTFISQITPEKRYLVSHG